VTFGLQFHYNLTENVNGEEIIYEDAQSATSNSEMEISEELVKMEDEYLKIIHALSSLQVEQRVSARQQDMHNDHVQSNNNYSYYFGYGEAIFLVFLAGFQIYYVMKMLEKRVLL
jgi:emp24/gp25L/p24 family/GOLD